MKAVSTCFCLRCHCSLKKQLCRKRGGARKHRVSAATHTSLELKGRKPREAKEFHKCVRMLIYCLLLYVFQLTDMGAFVVYRFLRSSCEMIVPMEFADIEVCLSCLFSDLAAWPSRSLCLVCICFSLDCRPCRWMLCCALGTRSSVRVFGLVDESATMSGAVHVGICSGNEEFQYKKPFEEARFLLCEHQTVSVVDMALTLIIECQSRLVRVWSFMNRFFFFWGLPVIGDPGKIMILEQDAVPF